MDRDIAGLEPDHPADGIQEGVHRVPRQAGDQVHVDARKSRLHRVFIGPEGLGRVMAAADAAQDFVGHGLGIDAHAVRAALADDPQLLHVQGIRPPALHGELQALRQVEVVTDHLQKPRHLRRGEGGGRAAAHIQAADGPAGFF